MARLSDSPDRAAPAGTPGLWLTEATDREGRPLVHPEVLAVARRNWPWAHSLVTRQLGDAPQAASICEEVAIGVTRRLHENPTVGRDLDSYFRTAMINRVRTEATRARRIVYLGAAYELESICSATTSGDTVPYDNKIILASLASFMTHEVRVILHYLQARYTWKEISTRIHLSEKQVRSRFYYGVRRAYEQLLDQKTRRAWERGEKGHGPEQVG